MTTLRLIELYPSPFSERVRWALEYKGLQYERRSYLPIAGEAEHRQRTGIATAPVLLAGDEIIGDSNRALTWLERRHPTPSLLPADARLRAQVRAWEAFASETLAPYARLGFIGRAKALGIQPLADHFAAKYHWSEAEEARAVALLADLLPDLARAVDSAPYLVGDTFTRADLTMVCMLATVFGHPDDTLFALDDGMRPMFGLPLGDEPALASLRQWRDGIYRRHRGGRVTPPA
jgi:glutathione S-transferase